MEVLIVLFLLVALALIGLVLIQQGKGADMGASFGAGASATVFGSGGAGNFLTRATAITAIAFFVLSLLIGRMTANANVEETVIAPVASEVAADEAQDQVIPD